MNRTWIAAGAIAVASLAAGGEARAQYWLSNRALNEGRGIRAGNFELHPGVGAEFGYDSNTFVRPAGEETPSLRLRITPNISLSTLSPQRALTGGDAAAVTALPTANFRAHLSLQYLHFFPLSDRNSDLFARLGNPNLGAQAGFRLELFPRRTWQFIVYDDIARVVQGGPEFGIALFVYNGIRNTGGAELVFAPNGGVLEARLGYQNRLMYFENPGFQQFNNMAHEISLRNRWRFLPKTALVWEGAFTPTVFYGPTGNSGTGLFSSFPVRSRFGVNGLLTERLGLLLLVGYQGTYFVGGDNADTIVAQGELKYIFSPVASLQFGLQRDVQPSFIGNYYVRNRAYLQLTQSFGGRFWLSAEGNAGIYQFGYATKPTGELDPGRIINADPEGRFSSVRLQGLLFGEYRFSEIFGVNATTAVTGNLTDAVLNVNLAADPTMRGPQSLQWTKFEAFLGARLNW